MSRPCGPRPSSTPSCSRSNADGGRVVLFTAINLVGEFLGSPGFSIEEGAALIVGAVMLIVAYFANQQREIPALTRATPHTDDAFSDTLVSGTGSSNNNTVNPTTASILTTILGTTPHADQEQVSSAITTLSSGEFGAEVQRTMDAAKAAQQTTIDVREVSPAEGETGQTLERVLVKPVPLPGQTAQSLVDPSTIPGLEPGRTFVWTAWRAYRCLLQTRVQSPFLRHPRNRTKTTSEPCRFPPCQT